MKPLRANGNPRQPSNQHGPPLKINTPIPTPSAGRKKKNAFFVNLSYLLLANQRFPLLYILLSLVNGKLIAGV